MYLYTETSTEYLSKAVMQKLNKSYSDTVCQ